MGGHEIDLTLGRQDKNTEIYILKVLMTSSNPVSFILIRCELEPWRGYDFFF